MPLGGRNMTDTKQGRSAFEIHPCVYSGRAGMLRYNIDSNPYLANSGMTVVDGNLSQIANFLRQQGDLKKDFTWICTGRNCLPLECLEKYACPADVRQ
ncbi:hypothetical protein MRB53_023613 [Persea americana]|uniref:Uncharacterized protein n=1 Tax=Persea americana TaxID=3435 RepID=A0ACC2LAL5_PERAE|nr:hypothetical protein MRB53_023613 [Persea americana]